MVQYMLKTLIFRSKCWVLEAPPTMWLTNIPRAKWWNDTGWVWLYVATYSKHMYKDITLSTYMYVNTIFLLLTIISHLVWCRQEWTGDEYFLCPITPVCSCLHQTKYVWLARQYLPFLAFFLLKDKYNSPTHMKITIAPAPTTVQRWNHEVIC